MRKRIFAVSFAVGFLLIVTGCSETKKDAPEPSSNNIVDGSRGQVIRFPNGFRNVAVSCYKGNGVYVTSRGDVKNGYTSSSIAVIPSDPICN
jgi:hypothetical protein